MRVSGGLPGPVCFWASLVIGGKIWFWRGLVLACLGPARLGPVPWPCPGLDFWALGALSVAGAVPCARPVLGAQDHAILTGPRFWRVSLVTPPLGSGRGCGGSVLLASGVIVPVPRVALPRP